MCVCASVRYPHNYRACVRPSPISLCLCVCTCRLPMPCVCVCPSVHPVQYRHVCMCVCVCVCVCERHRRLSPQLSWSCDPPMRRGVPPTSWQSCRPNVIVVCPLDVVSVCFPRSLMCSRCLRRVSSQCRRGRRRGRCASTPKLVVVCTPNVVVVLVVVVCPPPMLSSSPRDPQCSCRSGFPQCRLRRRVPPQCRRPRRGRRRVPHHVVRYRVPPMSPSSWSPPCIPNFVVVLCSSNVFAIVCLPPSWSRVPPRSSSPCVP